MMSPVGGLEGTAPVVADDDSFFQSMFASVDIVVKIRLVRRIAISGVPAQHV